MKVVEPGASIELSGRRTGCRLALLTFVVVALFILAACAAPAPAPARQASPTRLTVYAATSLADVFEVIGKDFTAANPGVEVLFNLGGSQQLAQQLTEGAPGDLFASANLRQMQVVIESGRIAAETRHIFARNRLVVVYPADNPAEITTLADLAVPGLKLVIAAESVPAGEYTLQFLERAGADPAFAPDYRDAVLANVVSYEENVRSVLNKVVLGEADAGVVYSSDVSPQLRESVSTIEIPDALNVLAEYPVAPLMDAQNPELAKRFVDHLISAEGQSRLQEYGFVPVTATGTP